MSTKHLPSLSLASLGLLLPAACTEAPRLSDSELRAAVCPAPELVQHAVCVCGDFTQTGDLTIERGPAGVGSIGVNGVTELVARSQIAGSWYAWGGLFSIGTTGLGVAAGMGGSLVTPGDVTNVGELSIGGDLQVGGDLESTGSLTVGGTLGVGGTTDLVGDDQIAKRGAYQAPAAPPCGCDAATGFDVAAAVAAARQAAGGETSEELVGEHRVRLTTGAYYLANPRAVGDIEREISGNVSVFVDGSLESIGKAQWKLTPGARLSLFVAGEVSHVGNLLAGSEAAPDAFQLYIGGERAALDVVGDSAFFGSIYAPSATLAYVGNTRVVGSIYAKELSGVGELTVAYGRPVTPPSSCDAPPSPGDNAE